MAAGGHDCDEASGAGSERERGGGDFWWLGLRQEREEHGGVFNGVGDPPDERRAAIGGSGARGVDTATEEGERRGGLGR
jgi:hypothetical protein